MADGNAADGDAAEAEAGLRQALEIFQRIGAAPVAGVSGRTGRPQVTPRLPSVAAVVA